MFRALKTIIAAILLSSPTMPPESAKGFAEVIQKVSAVHDIDPLDLVALVNSESKWRSGLTNSIGCIGLTQICPQFFPCDEACRQSLYDPNVNLSMAAKNIATNRKFCQKKTGRAKRKNWLFSLGGYNVPSKNVYCGMKKTKGRWVEVPSPPAIKRILKFRSRLPR